MYMVSAWAESNQQIFGQHKVDEKPNQVKAVPELLKLLVISGYIVTIDTKPALPKTLLKQKRTLC